MLVGRLLLNVPSRPAQVMVWSGAVLQSPWQGRTEAPPVPAPNPLLPPLRNALLGPSAGLLARSPCHRPGDVGQQMAPPLQGP